MKSGYGLIAFLIIAILFMALLARCFPLAHADAATVTGCYLVRLRPGTAVTQGDIIGLNWVRLWTDTQKAAEDVYKGLTDASEPCYVMRTQDADATVNDPLARNQWALVKADVLNAWDYSRGGGKTVVVVFDTGGTPTHPDMLYKDYGGKSFVQTATNYTDGNGHGTHTAGTIAASTNNGVGVAGVAYNTKISYVQVLNAQGSGDTGGIAQGVNEATAAIPPGYKAVYNFSLGCECPPPQVLADAIANAAAHDIVLVAAAGNNNADTRQRSFYPANFSQVLSVAATDEQDRKAQFSNYGNVSLAAPGVNILSTVPKSAQGLSDPSGYKLASGTSMASPHVAAIAALVRAAHPTWSAAQVRSALLATARKPQGYTQAYYGAGIVDAGAAVRYGGGVVPVPTRSRPDPTATPPGGEWGRQLEALINSYRAANHLPALRHDDRLAAAADNHNRYEDVNNCFAHQCPGEPDPIARMRATGYPVVSGGENIGRGYQTPQAMLQGWKDSPAHNAALLNTYWPDIGCAFLDGGNGYYLGLWWDCTFARGGTYQAEDAPPVWPFLSGPLMWKRSD